MDVSSPNDGKIMNKKIIFSNSLQLDIDILGRTSGDQFPIVSVLLVP